MRPDDIILLADGGGGSRTKRLVERVLLPHLANPILSRMDDAACLSIPENDLVFTTDSFVVDPLFFPGGDIGTLAICGTINDLAMQGGEPRYLSLALILEEGLALRDLERIASSMAAVLRATGVRVVTGDTKVVERGRGSGVFINTSGIGIRWAGVDVSVANARPGDAILVSGTLGDHGVAVMSRREGLAFETALPSDVAPLWPMVRAVLAEIPAVRCLRDPTRGGLAAALCDIAAASQVGLRIEERRVPVKKEVLGACRLLGLDPLNVANEGKAVLICAAADAARVLQILRAHPLGHEACAIGTVTSEPRGLVLMQTVAGGERIIEMPTGEDLPRIC